MASEKRKEEDKVPTPSLPQRNIEMEFFDLAKETTDSIGIFDDLWPPFPYFQIPDVHGVPQPCVEEVLLPSICSMDDSQFRFSQSPNIGHDYIHGLDSNISCLGENVNEFGQRHGHDDLFPPSNELPVATHNKDLQEAKVEREVKTTTSDTAKGLEIFREGGEANRTNLHTPWPVQNQTTRGSTAPWSVRSQITRQNNAPVSTQNLLNQDMEIKNGAMMSAVQPDHPPILDGSFLNLGVGAKTETRFNSDVSSRDSTTMGGVSGQLSNDFRQQDHSGYLDPCFKMDGVFSSVTDNASRFHNPVQNGGFSSLEQEIDGFSGVAQNVGGGSRPVHSVNEFSSLVPGVGGIFHPSLNGKPFSHQSLSVGVVSHQPHNVNRLPTPMENFGGLSGPAQSMSGFSHQALKVNELPSCLLNFDKISSQALNVGRFSHEAPNVDRSSRVLQNVDEFSGSASSRGGTTMPHLVDNQRYPYIKNDSSFGLRQNQHAGFAGGDPSTGLQGFPTDSLMLQSSSQPVMSGYGLRMETGFLPSPLHGGDIQGAYGQLQNHHIGIARNSSSESSLDSPFVEVSRSITGQGPSGQSFQTNGIRDALAAERCQFSRNLGVQESSQLFRTNEIRAALAAAEGDQFSRNLGVQQSRNLGQSPAAVSLQHLNSLSRPAYTTGQQIPAASGSSQASGLPQPSRKRVATELPHSTPQTQPRKTRKLIPSQVATSLPPAHLIPPIAQTAQQCLAQRPSIQPPPFQIAPSRTHLAQIPPSRTHLAQNAPSRTHLAQTAPSRTHLAQTAPSRTHLAQTAPSRTHLAQTAPSRTHLAQTAPSRSHLAQTPPSHTHLAQTAPSRTHLAQTAPSRTHLAQTAPSHSHLAQTPPSRTHLAQTAPSRMHLAQIAPSPSHLAQIAASRSLLSRIAASRRLLPHALPGTDPSPHIKRQDADETPQLSGRQCHICKRDLSYEPEGPVYQPKNPPPVAVLHCKHHFHAHCLELITTKDQAENPPCIPCALGEKS